MKHIRIFENFDSFYKDEMFYIEMIVGSRFGELSEIVKLSKKLVILFSRNNIEFRTYYNPANSGFDTEDIGIIFLFNTKIDLDKLLKFDNREKISNKYLQYLRIDNVELKEIPKNIESIRIPDNDIDLSVSSVKYNL